jgi:hypothetical protein
MMWFDRGRPIAPPGGDVRAARAVSRTAGGTGCGLVEQRTKLASEIERTHERLCQVIRN